MTDGAGKQILSQHAAAWLEVEGTVVVHEYHLNAVWLWSKMGSNTLLCHET